MYVYVVYTLHKLYNLQKNIIYTHVSYILLYLGLEICVQGFSLFKNLKWTSLSPAPHPCPPLRVPSIAVLNHC